MKSRLPTLFPRLVIAALAVTAGLSSAPAATDSTVNAPIHWIMPVPGTPAQPDGQRIPFGWPAIKVDATPVRLMPPGSPPNDSGEIRFRLTFAVNARDLHRVAVTIPTTGEAVGEFDLRFVHAIEIFELAVPRHLRRKVLSDGLELRKLGDGPALWCFAGVGLPPDVSGLPLELQPHLLANSPENEDPIRAFHRRFASIASIQAFGWMEGCVMEGLRALADQFDDEDARAALDLHWSMFLKSDGSLIYENPGSKPFDNLIYGIEAGLPFAELVRRDPWHPLLDQFVAFTHESTKPSGGIQDYSLTAEGSYTIAFPLALLAQARDRPDLAAIAFQQLTLRSRHLWHDGAQWLRYYEQDDSRTYRGWARGVAWHLLGLVHSIEPLREFHDTTALEADLRRIVTWLLPLQGEDGLWSCFVEEPSIRSDTSGSAGIAVAIARAARMGILPPETSAAARHTLDGCIAQLSPDGLLTGVAQSNSAGEALQRSDYRVISQMGAGLLAQLFATCDRSPASSDTSAINAHSP